MPFNFQEVLAQLRLIAWSIRHGRTEKAVLAVTGGLFVAGTWLLTSAVPESLKEPTHALAYGLYACGGLLLAWIGYRIIFVYAVARPIEDESSLPRSAAVKGPMAFGPGDAELFRRLEREDELSKLLSLILNDQIALLVVRGASGVGKTSILRAGLSHMLKAQDIQYIYWEAVPTQCAERLLHAIQEQWQDSAVPQGLEEVLRASHQEAPRRVIVLDQFEQLHPDEPTHQAIFAVLRALATSQMPPHRTTWIVAFRREYDALWRDFELTISDFHPPMLPIPLFSERQAQEVLAALAEAATLTLDQALVIDFVQAAGRNGRIAGVDLGIGLLVLNELARQKGTDHLRLTDYRFAGGAEGLLTGYLSDCLERFPTLEREAVLKALLFLIDRETKQRLAEGHGLSALAQEAAWPPPRLQSCLDYLASSHVRLLEKLPDGADHLPAYRLPHERLVPSLLQLAGIILAEMDQARLTFDAAFRAWNNNGQHSRYLLDGPALSTMAAHHAHLSFGEDRDAKAKFLQRSIQKRKRTRGVQVLLGLLVLGSIVGGWWIYTEQSLKENLRAWRVPSDLYSSYQRQLKTLSINNAPITHLEWLKADLLTLSIQSAALGTLHNVPRTLTTLDLSNSGLTSLAGLEKLPQLTKLNLSRNRLTSLAGLEKLPQLTTLDVSNTRLTSLAGLEKLPQLTKLNLRDTRLPSLAGLEKLPQLTTLDVSNTRLPSLAGLEKLPQLTTLDVSDNRLPSLAGLEKLPQLTKLNLRRNRLPSLAGLEKLPQLTTLDVSDTRLPSLAGLEKLPQLTTLDVSNTRLPSLAGLEKLPQLTKLNLRRNGLPSLAGLEKLPQLTTLDVSYSELTSLAGLEKLPQLTTLDVSGNELTSLAGLEKLPQLTKLNLRRNRLPSLAGLEKLPQLTDLDVSDNRLPSLAGLEKLPQLTTLDVSGNELTSLAGLEKLPQLTTLDVSGNGLPSLAGLEKLPQLTKLNLRRNRLPSLAGLEKLPQLTDLDVSDNRLPSLAGLEKLPQLTDLDVSNSELTSLTGLEKLPQLTTLDVSGTRITDIKMLVDFRSLKTLSLPQINSLNGLPSSVTSLSLNVGFPGIPEVIHSLTRMHFLDLGNVFANSE